MKSTMLTAMLTEFIGTFVLVSVVVTTNGAPIAAGVALAAAIYLINSRGPGHCNSAVSVAMLINGKIRFRKFVIILAAQVAAAFAAIGLVRLLKTSNTM